MRSLDRATWKTGVRAGTCAIWVLLALGVTSCNHQRVTLQVYGGDAQTDEALAAFAAGRGLAIERPGVAPVQAKQVVVMYSRGWETYAAATELEQLLRELGRDVRVVEAHLRNHVVTRGHIAVFLDPVEGDFVAVGAQTVGEVHQLTCTQEHGEALVLLFDNFEMEIQTYIWEEEAISGANHYGTWATSDGTVSLLPSDGNSLEYDASAACLTAPPDGGGSCRGFLRWQRGDSVPILAGCDLEARDLIMATKDMGTR